MSKKKENVGFVCKKCSAEILPCTNGGYRNHCPVCLYSLHVDNEPGDRSNHCYGLMEPIGMHYHSRKGWQIIHRCLKCAEEKVNRIAEQTIQEDDWEKLVKLGTLSLPLTSYLI